MYIFDLAIAIKVVLDKWTLVPQLYHKHSLPFKALVFSKRHRLPEPKPSVRNIHKDHHTNGHCLISHQGIPVKNTSRSDQHMAKHMEEKWSA